MSNTEPIKKDVTEEKPIAQMSWRGKVMALGAMVMFVALFVGRATDGSIVAKVLGVLGLVAIGVGVLASVVAAISRKATGADKIAQTSEPGK